MSHDPEDTLAPATCYANPRGGFSESSEALSIISSENFNYATFQVPGYFTKGVPLGYIHGPPSRPCGVFIIIIPRSTQYIEFLWVLVLLFLMTLTKIVVTS
jgi:hypothetical protein